jgi:hypothetical protein
MRDQKPRLRKFACLAAIAAMLALSDRAAEMDLDNQLLVPASERFCAWLARPLRAYFFRVRCSSNRSGDPIVAGKRSNYYAINYPELQARIEIAHRPLIEVNDAARR